MIRVRFQTEKFQKDINKLLKMAEDMGASKEFKRAAKRAADAAKTVTKRGLAEQYTLPSKMIGDTIFSKYVGAGASMVIHGYTNRLVDFKGTRPNNEPVFGNAKKSSYISAVLNGAQNSAGGYIWKYAV